MSKRPWFPFDVADFTMDTLTMTAEEVGAYILLLNYYWNNQGPITTDRRELMKVCRLSPHVFAKNFTKISQKFAEIDGKYFNKRMDAEIAKANDITKKRVNSGSVGGVANAIAKGKHLPTQLQSQLQSHKEKRESDARSRASRLSIAS